MGLFDLFKKKMNPQIQQDAAAQEDEEKTSAQEDEEKTSAQEDLLSSIKQFREQQRSVREKFLEENDKKLAPAHEKIARAEYFINESGLDKSFPKVMKHIWHWASWSKNDSFGEYTAFDVSNITGNKNELKDWGLQFKYQDHLFEFNFREQDSYHADEYQFADMSLTFDNNKVLEIGCNLDRGYDDWSYTSVSHLVIGDWVRYIVEMYELIELYDIKEAREFGSSMIIDQAENLPE